MLLWLSWINKIFSIKYHGVAIHDTRGQCLLSGVPDYFGRNKISSGGDLSHYSSVSLY